MCRVSSLVSRRAAAALLGAAATLRPHVAEATQAATQAAQLLSLPAGSRARALLESKLRPPIKSLPRRTMSMPFAVKLMRTSYQVADDMDFMPMDVFQKRFFSFRQEEWEPYHSSLPRVTQGELSDPGYFDFISFAQYATIAAGMRDAVQVFEERVDADGMVQVVSRPQDLADNAALPSAHATRVGDVLLDFIIEDHPEYVPRPRRGLSEAELLIAVQRLLDCFEIGGYMLSSRVTLLPRGVEVALVAPASIWSQQVLSLRGDLVNDFESKVICAWLRAAGLPARSSTRVEKGIEVVHTFSWM